MSVGVVLYCWLWEGSGCGLRLGRKEMSVLALIKGEVYGGGGLWCLPCA